MRRLIIIALALAYCATESIAGNNGLKNFLSLIKQDTHPTGVHDTWDLYVGPRVGVNVATLTNTGGTPVIGFTGGGFFEVFIMKNLSVEMDLAYSRQGANNVDYTVNVTQPNGSTESSKQQFDYALHYINTDYLCRWYPMPSRPLSIYSGLQLARLFKATAKSDHSSKIREDLHKGDVSIPIGVSYEWGQWQADMRFNYALRHIGRTERAKLILDNANNAMLSLTVAYKILLW